MKLYKKVFVNLAKVLPDSIYLRMVFFSKLKRKLDLSNPRSYNEKLNWLKINDRKEHYQIMVDKYEAKKYVADKIGEQYVIPTYGVWDRFEDIDFSKLPSNFVLKTTHDSGGVVLINDKNNMDIDKTMSFKVEKDNSIKAQEILKQVYDALVEKGYNPINQIVGYILSGDPTYITSHKNARNLIRLIERDELLEKMVKYYIHIVD